MSFETLLKTSFGTMNGVNKGMSRGQTVHPFDASAGSSAAIGRTAAIVVERMTLEDIPAVMTIERASFPRPWPESAYRYELIKNSNAYFVVARACLLQQASLAQTSYAQASYWQRLTRRLRGPRRQPMGDSAEQQVVGFAGMWMYVDEAHIATIATHPDWRGRGIGERILIALLREAQHRRAMSVTLEVRVSNLVAQNLYRKYGFEEVGRRRAYYQDNREDALLMSVTNFAERAYRERLDALEQHVLASTGMIKL